MTGKQIKRDFKKYLVDTKVEFRDKTPYIYVNLFIIDFTDDYVIVYIPCHTLNLLRINLYYHDAQSTFFKILRYHQHIHKKGLMIQGRVRKLADGKRQTHVFR